VRPGAQEFSIAVRRAAQSVAALVLADSRERRVAMDSNSVSVLMASPKQLCGERELPALQP
jgi:hypothetical protein